MPSENEDGNEFLIEENIGAHRYVESKSQSHPNLSIYTAKYEAIEDFTNEKIGEAFATVYVFEEVSNADGYLEWILKEDQEENENVIREEGNIGGTIIYVANSNDPSEIIWRSKNKVIVVNKYFVKGELFDYYFNKCS